MSAQTILGLVLTATVVGCSAEPPLILIGQNHDEPDRPEWRAPLRRPGSAVPAEDPWVREKTVRPVGTAPTAPWVTVKLDGQPAVREPMTGLWVVPEPVAVTPKLRYELADWAGTAERLIVLVSEYRAGAPVPETEQRILAGTDLPAGTDFELTQPGKGLLVRGPTGVSAESFELRPGTTYVLWLQLQTSGRRLSLDEPWEWPQVRFKTRPKTE